MAAQQDNYDEMLQVALRVAKQAGRVISARWNKPKVVDSKSSAVDMVTETDQECERIILAGIKEVYPEHKFVAEEQHSAEHANDDPNADRSDQYGLTDEPTWCIDPLDGTNNWVHNIPIVGVCVGLLVNKRPVLGVCHFPLLGETFSGIVGQGSFLERRVMREPEVDAQGNEASVGCWELERVRLQTSGVRRLQEAAVVTEGGYDRSPEGIQMICQRLEQALLQNAQSVRFFGCCAYNMCSVAVGRVDAYWEGRDEKEGPKPWDFTAAAVIVGEAGGLILDPVGAPFDLCSGRVLTVASAELGKQISDVLRPVEINQNALKRPEAAGALQQV